MDKEWIVDTLRQLSSIGKSEKNGLNRLAFSNEDMQARFFFKNLLSRHGLHVREDTFGNIIARLEGTDPSLPAVATGSHLDTVPNAGAYDGMLGCVVGLAALLRAAERGSRRRPLELIIFQMEESSRFSQATVGSKIMSGQLHMDTWRKAHDKHGVTLPQAMLEQGYGFEEIPQAIRAKGELSCFIELHIEQSADLEAASKPIGIVSAIAAPIRVRSVIKGRAGHSGGTAMNNRRDALVSAAELIIAVRAIGNSYARRQIVATVSDIAVSPGAINVIPGQAELLIDLRGTDRTTMDEAFAAIHKAASSIEAIYDTPISFILLESENPVSMSPSIIALLKDTAGDLNIPTTTVVSGAGHDAMNMAAITNVGMIFIRCADGWSHHPSEYATPQDIDAGLKLLTETLYRLAV